MTKIYYPIQDIYFYKLNYSIKKELMNLQNITIIEEMADLFDRDPCLWLKRLMDLEQIENCIVLTNEKSSHLFMTRYRGKEC